MWLGKRLPVCKKISNNKIIIKKLNKNKIIIGKVIPQLTEKLDILENLIKITEKLNFFPKIVTVKNNIIYMNYYPGIDGRILLFIPLFFKRLGKIMKKFHVTGQEILGKNYEIRYKSFHDLVLALEKIFYQTNKNYHKQYKQFLEKLFNSSSCYITLLHNDFTLRNIKLTWQGIKIFDFEGIFHPSFPNPFFNIFDVGIFLFNLISYYNFLSIFGTSHIRKCIKFFLSGYGMDRDTIYAVLKLVGIYHYFGFFIDRPLLEVYAHKKNYKTFKCLLEGFLFNDSGKIIDFLNF